MTTKIIHDCTQADNIQAIKKEIRQMEIDVASLKPEVHGMNKILEGNGQKGLKEVVILLSANVSELGIRLIESKADRKELRESINDLINYKSTLESSFMTTDRENTKRGVRAAHLQWLIGVIITLVLGLATLTLTVVKEKKSIKAMEEHIETIR
jgi:hypothetical protein